MYPDIAKQVTTFDSLLASLVPKSLADVEKGLGQPSGRRPDSTYVMPIVQNRLIGIGGLHVAPSRSHTEFYPVDSVGGLLVWYTHDSTTVAARVAYLKLDSQFLPCTRETQNQLDTRLSWDNDRLAVLERALRARFGK
jgi:hypothetical protein